MSKDKKVIKLTVIEQGNSKKRDSIKENPMIKATKNFAYSGIEWRAHTPVDISKEESKEIENMLELFQEDDDIQNVFHNCKFV